MRRKIFVAPDYAYDPYYAGPAYYGPPVEPYPPPVAYPPPLAYEAVPPVDYDYGPGPGIAFVAPDAGVVIGY